MSWNSRRKEIEYWKKNKKALLLLVIVRDASVFLFVLVEVLNGIDNGCKLRDSKDKIAQEKPYIY